MKSVCKVLVLSTSLTAQMTGHGVQPGYAGPHSLGPYRLDHDTSVKSVLATLEAKPSGRNTYCFEDKSHGLYLYLEPMDDRSGRVAAIFLSSFPNCRHLPVLATMIDPAIWKTQEGISIGSAEMEVARVYGKPVVEGKPDARYITALIRGRRETDKPIAPLGDLSYLYNCQSQLQGCSNDNRATQIGLRQGKLIWIHVSNAD